MCLLHSSSQQSWEPGIPETADECVPIVLASLRDCPKHGPLGTQRSAESTGCAHQILSYGRALAPACQGGQRELGSQRQPLATGVITFPAEHGPGQEVRLQEASLGQPPAEEPEAGPSWEGTSLLVSTGDGGAGASRRRIPTGASFCFPTLWGLALRVHCLPGRDWSQLLGQIMGSPWEAV